MRQLILPVYLLMYESTLFPYVSRNDDGSVDLPIFNMLNSTGVFILEIRRQDLIIAAIAEARKLLRLLEESGYLGVSHVCLDEKLGDTTGVRFSRRLSISEFLSDLRIQASMEEQSSQN